MVGGIVRSPRRGSSGVARIGAYYALLGAVAAVSVWHADIRQLFLPWFASAIVAAFSASVLVQRLRGDGVGALGVRCLATAAVLLLPLLSTLVVSALSVVLPASVADAFVMGQLMFLAAALGAVTAAVATTVTVMRMDFAERRRRAVAGLASTLSLSISVVAGLAIVLAYHVGV